MVAALLHNVSLQHGFLFHDASEAKVAQVECFKVAVQNEFCHGEAHSRGLLEAVATESSGKVHVVDQRVDSNDGVLVEGVVVVETCPGTGQLTGRDKRF